MCSSCGGPSTSSVRGPGSGRSRRHAEGGPGVHWRCPGSAHDRPAPCRPSILARCGQASSEDADRKCDEFIFLPDILIVRGLRECVVEAHKFLQTPLSGATSVSMRAQCPTQRAISTSFWQTGHSSLVTKTSGTVGGGGAPPMNMAAIVNVHPSAWIPIERRDAGTNHVAVKGRTFVATRRPVEPHHGTSLGLQMGLG